MYWIKNGGVLLYVIIFMSVIGITVIIERLVYYKIKEKDNQGEIDEKVKKHIEKGEIKEAILDLNEKKSSSAMVLRDILIYFYKNKNTTITSLEEKGKEKAMAYMPQVERNMWLLSLVAHTTPLLGLLGTVIGMIKAFQGVALHGTGDATVLATGIYEALITTAGGLIAAIPALFFYNYFNKKIDEIYGNIEKNVTELINYFR
ncbi:MotA/TolQ/ExbB proton channel family protein [Fusobacterium sp. PH5-44]|uniref:MotA/TolQ/ExbB proton channel family protein n=1 Tax=unclassified Fusobacterium TaxID=2648384 RepID=UPI003D19E54E